jgi:hypothetical protein
MAILAKVSKLHYASHWGHSVRLAEKGRALAEVDNWDGNLMASYAADYDEAVTSLRAEVRTMLEQRELPADCFSFEIVFTELNTKGQFWVRFGTTCGGRHLVTA